MKVDTGKLQILTVAAMLVLISGGIGAYAQGQSSQTTSITAIDAASSTTSTTSATNSTSTQTSSTTKTSTVTSTVTATTTATSTTSSTAANYTLCTPPTAPGQIGRLVLPITPTTQSQTGAISFSDSRGCLASITTVGGIFSVGITLRYAKPVTQYNVVLVANGTTYTLGNMVTGPDGSGQMQNQVLLKTGTYVVSIQIFDTSTNPGQSTLVLQTGQGTIVSPPFPTASSGQQPKQGDQGNSGQHK